MNLPVSPADHVYLAHVEEQARLHETVAGQYRDIAAMLRATFKLSPVATPAPPPPPRLPLTLVQPDAPVVETRETLEEALAATDRAIAQLEAPPMPRPKLVPPRQYTKTLDRDKAIVGILTKHGPCRRGVLHELTGQGSLNSLERALDRLMANGTVIKTGERAATHYALAGETREKTPEADLLTTPADLPVVTAEPVDRVDTSLQDDSVEAPAATTAERSESSRDQRRARMAFLLLDKQILGADPKHIGDLVIALSERMHGGVAPVDDVIAVLMELVGRGEVQTIRKGHETHYLRPTLKARRVIKERLMEERFNGPGQQARAALLDYARMVPGGTAAEVDIALTELVREMKIQVRTIGPDRFYSRRMA